MDEKITLRDGTPVPVFTAATLARLDTAEVADTGALLLIDKPSGWTSFDVVARSRSLLRIRKVGHAGTLDPMATGLLVLCLARATKVADVVQAGEKEYVGTMRFGASTPTDDAESPEEAFAPFEHLDRAAISSGAATFVGEIMQRAPAFSARKIDGERMYRRARRGEAVEAIPRPVSVRRFEITDVRLPDVDFRIICSKGTYIRSLARDLGLHLQSLAYLTALRRTRIGSFLIDDAITLDQVEQHARNHRL